MSDEKDIIESERLICDSCGDAHECVWHAENEVWNAVVGQSSGRRCPNCFIREGIANGVSCSWRIDPCTSTDTERIAQRDHDNESIRARVAELEGVMRAMIAKYDQCKPHIDGAFVFAHIHGQNYIGPNMGDEVAACRAALAANQQAMEATE